ncbi:hypothetical protein L915_14305 [Phytophthora nicotianae]|uniref:Uncharacterized protein n=1 Tax=Phytophthora nicotianae TaxID=4792 RepID=W2GCE5_PHYNI|nr:hypothetical protein L915_14305 [Phytophthora nicotianae]ETL33300.1 hypothetical protein L916_14211 [Phytophthora nicotianae]
MASCKPSVGAYKGRALRDSSRPNLGETYNATCDDLESNSGAGNENCIDRSVSPLDDICNFNFSTDDGETADGEKKSESVHEEEEGYETSDSYGTVPDKLKALSTQHVVTCSRWQDVAFKSEHIPLQLVTMTHVVLDQAHENR